MSIITIRMNSDGSYILDPPVVIINKADQGITWNLAGSNWGWAQPDGIVCDTNAPNPPYTAWPSGATGPTFNSTTNQYTANANSPNNSGSWIFYKWAFNVRNSSTGQSVNADPDIGNQP